MLVALTAVVAAGGAEAAVTHMDGNGTVLVDGKKVFPIVLAKGPPPNGTTPAGSNAIAEVTAAGVNFLKVGPATVPWTTADIDEAKVEDQAAKSNGAYTWINLATLSTATAGSSKDALLAQVIQALEADPSASAIGMWKGADEPWFSGITTTALQLAFCRSTGRGQAGWCAGEPVLDQDHLWVTIQAPRGTSTDLAPYAAVTDVHGVDIYPVTAASPAPDLHQVGNWTSTLAAITPNHGVWTTLQICASGSVGPNGTFVLPSRAQERFMIYDAIINGARSLAFYGGNNPDCWSGTDSQFQWSWSFWNSTLKGLIAEIGASSPVAPALVDPGSNVQLQPTDASVEAASRSGSAGDLWVFAAHTAATTQTVTIPGLPAGVTSADVYTEGRTVSVSNGSLTDTFGPWDVHVYHLAAPPPRPPAPTIASVTPSSGAPGDRVTIAGAHLGGTTSVSFGGVQAGFAVTSDSAVSATVPAGAATGPIAVTTPAGTATSSFTFTVTSPPPPAPPPPPPSGGGGSAGQAVPSDLRLALSAASATAAVDGTDDVLVTALDAGGGSTHVVLTIDLPAGLALVGPPAYERGSGCTGQSVVVCNLDFLQSSSPTHVRFSVRAVSAGTQQISASITAAESDANPADNSAALTITIPSPPVPVAPTPPTAPKAVRATQHADRLVGTRGPDTLRGLGGGDTILGLAGNDVLDGGPGNDTIVGGPGRDILIGGPGNDVLSARDGQRDRIRCGTGQDRVIADRLDVVARDCEIVRRR